MPVQPGGDELEKPVPAVEAAQPVQSEVEQPGTVRQPAGVLGGRGGAQYLPAVRGGGHPCGPVHLGRGVLAGVRFGVAGVQAHAYPGAAAGRPVVRGQGALGVRARGQRGARVGEGDEQRIAFGEQLRTVRSGQPRP